jgi:hypothetical protein
MPAFIDLDLLSPGVLLTDAEATQALRLGKGTLRKWRREGRKPPYLTLEGRYVRYRAGDLRAWLNGSTSAVCEP